MVADGVDEQCADVEVSVPVLAALAEVVKDQLHTYVPVRLVQVADLHGRVADVREPRATDLLTHPFLDLGPAAIPVPMPAT